MIQRDSSEIHCFGKDNPAVLTYCHTSGEDLKKKKKKPFESNRLMFGLLRIETLPGSLQTSDKIFAFSIGGCGGVRRRPQRELDGNLRLLRVAGRITRDPRAGLHLTLSQK